MHDICTGFIGILSTLLEKLQSVTMNSIEWREREREVKMYEQVKLAIANNEMSKLQHWNFMHAVLSLLRCIQVFTTQFRSTAITMCVLWNFCIDSNHSIRVSIMGNPSWKNFVGFSIFIFHKKWRLNRSGFTNQYAMHTALTC